MDVYDGLVCDNTIQIRRVAWWSYAPSHFDSANFKVAKWDADFVATLDANETLKNETLLDEDHSVFSRFPWKDKLLPSSGWAVPFVTGHTYRINWGDGLDFTQMKMWQSERWETTDSPINIVFNFTDVR